MTHPRILTTALIVFMLVIAWEFNRTAPISEPYLWIPVTVAFASPVADWGTQTPDVFEVTASAYFAGTAVPTPYPPYPTVTPRPSCTGALSPGAICFGPTAVPTPVPANIVPAPTPLTNWPGDALATPGRMYVWAESEGTP